MLLLSHHTLAGRTVEDVRADLQHLMSQHNTSQGLMRVGGRPVYFVYDSYRLPAQEWARLLGQDGNITVRGTELDGGSACSNPATDRIVSHLHWHKESVFVDKLASAAVTLHRQCMMLQPQLDGLPVNVYSCTQQRWLPSLAFCCW
jgi:hypothetical protein